MYVTGTVMLPVKKKKIKQYVISARSMLAETLNAINRSELLC
jgi:hypothetical protein